MTRKQKRLAVIGGGMSFIVAAVLLVMFAFSQSIAYFYMPSDLASNPIAPGTLIRLGGLVDDGSVQKSGGAVVLFSVTDGKETIPVRFKGILPDLFREGQGVVAEGRFEAGTDVFDAETVLAKHDERYMPKEVAERLKSEGVWEGKKPENGRAKAFAQKSAAEEALK